MSSFTDLETKYSNEIFESSSQTTEQFKGFVKDVKKAFKNSFDDEYEITWLVGHFEIGGFVEWNNKFVYFSIGDVRMSNWYEDILYRTAKSNSDYTGGFNCFCKLLELDIKIKSMLERE